jgi:DNA-binding CsgD family transcriptional regulator
MDHSNAFSKVIEFLPDATFVIDREGKVIAWNRAIEKMTGVPKEEILGKGEHVYAIGFYGKPVPMLIDLVLNRSSERPECYDSTDWKGNTLFAECWMGNLFGRGNSYLRGAASALYDYEGNIIGAFETIRDITDWKKLELMLTQREKDLQANAGQLRDTNVALKVLFKAREDDQKNFEKLIHANLKGMVLPYLDKLRGTRLDQRQRAYLDVLESAFQEIFSPFLSMLKSKFQDLTPTEVHVANLIKEGKTSRKIAEILDVAEKTIEIHRYNLRIKLGITNKKINLRSHLLSLER